MPLLLKSMPIHFPSFSSGLSFWPFSSCFTEIMGCRPMRANRNQGKQLLTIAGSSPPALENICSVFTQTLSPSMCNPVKELLFFFLFYRWGHQSSNRLDSEWSRPTQDGGLPTPHVMCSSTSSSLSLSKNDQQPMKPTKDIGWSG